MKNWSRERWRKLFLRESAQQATTWLVMQRGVRDLCIRLAEDDGTLAKVRDGEDPVEVLARVLNAQPRERDLVLEAVTGLLDDGYLDFDGQRIFVVKLPAAQGDDDSAPVVAAPAKTPPKTAAERSREYRDRVKSERDAAAQASRNERSDRHETARDGETSETVTGSRGDSQKEATESPLAKQNNQTNQPNETAGERDTTRDGEDTKSVTAKRVTRPDPFTSANTPPHEADVTVLELWASRFQKKDVVRDTRRMYQLELRRLEGMTEQDAKDALEGAAADPWCCSKHNPIEIIFGERGRFEQYRDTGKAIRDGKAPPPLARAGQEQRQPNTGNYSAITHAKRIR